MKTNLTLFVAVLAAALFGSGCTGVPKVVKWDKHWPLDLSKSDAFTLKGGQGGVVEGVRGKSLALDGHAVLEILDSSEMAQSDAGCTIIVWENPYALNGKQQIIAGKSRYSLGEREWVVLLDKDNHFRLYLWQGRWQTIGAKALPRQGHWHLIGVVLRPDEGELWLDGKLAGSAKLGLAIPRTKAPLTLGGLIDPEHPQNLFGALDEARLINRPLSRDEVKALYDLEKPKAK